jgi:pimeloyl-ACP methyl ester carboxylesterase
VAERLRRVETPDGRTLAFATWGDPGGFPVLGNHGTPGSRFDRWPREGLYEELGVLLVSHDRAGYARSDRRRGRKIVDEVDDLLLLADHLGLDHFGVTGGSGGGPHALAAAARCPDRVLRAVCTVGVAPYGPEGLEHDAWLAGMDPENVKEFGWALAGEDVLARELTAEWAKIMAKLDDDPGAAVLGEFELSQADREELERPEVLQIIDESMREQALGGIFGWVDDSLAFTRPWGFDPGEIGVPVLLRYGSSDVLVPRGHGDWLAQRVPGAIVAMDEAGHLGSDPEQEITENIAWLRDGIPPARATAPPVAHG